MRVFCPSRGRSDIIQQRVLRLFPETEVVVATEEEREEYVAAGIKAPILVSNTPAVDGDGQARSRQWYLDTQVDPDEWVLSLNDNIIGIYGEHQSFISGPSLSLRLREIIKQAESLGVNLVGFEEQTAWDRSRWNSGEKWSWEEMPPPLSFPKNRPPFRFLCYGRDRAHHNFCLLRRRDVRQPIYPIDEAALTLEYLWRDGKVLQYQNLVVLFPWFEGGGTGTMAARIPPMVRHFPHFFQSYPPGILDPTEPHVLFLTRTVEELQRWREQAPPWSPYPRPPMNEPPDMTKLARRYYRKGVLADEQ